ncbi:MAG: peptidoglycan bridge formation glycyltransferase FemA/FemB family protein [Clostridiales bacterium]|nr:peptidoglycan bridge formation glycyltransferase FemA/FemB family protein [Clostridiales bacterium]
MHEIITKNTLPEYEEFIEAHKKGHFMQSSMWGKVKDNWIWEAVAVRDQEGKIKGALSVLIRRLPVLKYTLMYGGRGPVCDAHDEETIRELLSGVRELAKKYHSYTLKLDPDIEANDQQFLSIMNKLGFQLKSGEKNFEGIQPRFVFRLDVENKTEDEVMEIFHSKTRYNIRLAERKGVQVKLCGKEMLADFSRIMLETGVRDGFVIRPKAYFEKMLDTLGEHARLYMAFLDGKPIAGTLAIWFGDKVWYLYGASSNEYRNVMPNYLLQWNMIKWAIEKKCSIYDFRGVSGDLSEDNPLYGLYRFKKGFNGKFCEFAGEFDYVIKPAVNFAVSNGTTLFRNLRRAVFLKRHKHADKAQE